MTNWCDCELTVKAKDKEGVAKLAEFKRWVAGNEEPLSFDAVIPYPDKYREKDIKGYNEGGYQWCCNNWGTKWDASDVMMKETKDCKTLKYFFASAWSPPNPVVQAMGQKFPDLAFTLKYFEGAPPPWGMWFQGVFAMSDGHVDRDERWDYHGSRGG